MFLTSKYARHVLTSLVNTVKLLLQHHSGCCWLLCITSQTLTKLAFPITCKNIFELEKKLWNRSTCIIVSFEFCWESILCVFKQTASLLLLFLKGIYSMEVGEVMAVQTLHNMEKNYWHLTILLSCITIPLGDKLTTVSNSLMTCTFCVPVV